MSAATATTHRSTLNLAYISAIWKGYLNGFWRISWIWPNWRDLLFKSEHRLLRFGAATLIIRVRKLFFDDGCYVNGYFFQVLLEFSATLQIFMKRKDWGFFYLTLTEAEITISCIQIKDRRQSKNDRALLESDKSFPIWKWAIFLMSKAAQGFPSRRTWSTLQTENSRRTQLIEQRAISIWKRISGRPPAPSPDQKPLPLAAVPCARGWILFR